MNRFAEQERESLASHLRRSIRGEVRLDFPTRRLYATDASIYQMEPFGVVLPRDADDLQAIVAIASEMRIPLTPRGGGTSLSGQAVGEGLVVDCSKYMDAILDLDPIQQIARVQPGVVLDTLNRSAEAHGLLFGPDVSTGSRANLGGMIGNNSAGARSIVYGKTIDNVHRLDVVLSDGSRASFDALTQAEWEERAARNTFDGQLHRTVQGVVERNRDEIDRRYPKILRRVSGYNLPELAAPGKKGLHQLIIGSEGTLALTAEAVVKLLPRPKARGLLVPQFATLADAMNALAVCLEMSPSAVELMDQLLLELTAGNLALRDTTRHIDRRAKAIFMVEFSANDPAEVVDRAQKLAKRLSGVPGLITCLTAIEPSIRDPLWNLRRASMPLLYGMPGDRKPITFVEDTAVSPEKLPEYVARFKEILLRHGTDGSFYGHASVGCLHIRPLIDLKSAQQVVTMHRIAEEVADLVLEFNGSLSGEHGDGLTRSEWNPKMFGPILMDAFRQIKRAFDPKGIFNPGKIMDAPSMASNLRYPPDYKPTEPRTVFDYSKQDGFLRSVEMCNGNGACRKTTGGAMCPSYRATRDERDSTRGRANALRHALAEGADLRQRWLHEVFDLCLMCKACKSECPSNVDVGKLKAEFLQFYYRGRSRPLEHLMVGGLPYMQAWLSWVAPIINRIQGSSPGRWLLEKMAGIDRRRSLPPIHFQNFRRWFRGHRPDPLAGSRGSVLLLADCFTTYQEPNVARSAVRLLERAGYTVKLADLFCCGRVWISKGFLLHAKTWVARQAATLAKKLGPDTTIVGMEPSCLLTLADEWPELVPGPDTRHVAAAAKMADSFLAERGELRLRPMESPCVLHGHCHQKALLGNNAGATLLRQIPGVKLDVLDAGCCGMAGSFGYERGHFDLSAKIAGLALLPALAQRPAHVLAAPGTSCRHQIEDLSGRKALHPLEIVEKQLEPEPNS
ncbi:MAG: FAD-binding oxidoreductase [Planctomycetia bacterium]|nr:FAD-binding oxidoreductase [Planctomycetia bacterium]